MIRYSVLLLAFLGIVIMAAGAVELIRQAGVLTVDLDVFGSMLIVLLGLWIVTCAIECRKGYLEDFSKG